MMLASQYTRCVMMLMLGSLCVCVCVCVCLCDTLFMGMAAGVMYMML